MLRTIDRSLLVGVLGDRRGRESRKPLGSADVHGVLDRELLEREGAELSGDKAPEADERVAPEPVPLATTATQGLDPGDHEVGRELPLDSGRGGALGPDKVHRRFQKTFACQAGFHTPIVLDRSVNCQVSSQTERNFGFGLSGARELQRLLFPKQINSWVNKQFKNEGTQQSSHHGSGNTLHHVRAGTL